MISTVLALMLAAGPASADRVAVARREYSHCLSAFMKQSLKDKMAKDAYETALSTACSDKAQVFRGAAIAADTAVGIRKADAEENAASEIRDMMSNSKELFGDYLASGTAPQN